MGCATRYNDFLLSKKCMSKTKMTMTLKCTKLNRSGLVKVMSDCSLRQTDQMSTYVYASSRLSPTSLLHVIQYDTAYSSSNMVPRAGLAARPLGTQD